MADKINSDGSLDHYNSIPADPLNMQTVNQQPYSSQKIENTEHDPVIQETSPQLQKRVSFSETNSIYEDDNAIQTSSEDESNTRGFLKSSFSSNPHKSINFVIEDEDEDEDDENRSLPEFNKRPLSDTPVVSTVTSPDGKYITENENENENDSIEFTSMVKTNNISNLNLSSLNSLNQTLQQHKSAKSFAPPKISVEHPLLVAPTGSTIANTKNSFVPKAHLTNINTSSNTNPNPSPTNINLKLSQANISKIPSVEKLQSLLKIKNAQRKAATLDVPGQTRSRTSPDGTIANQDIGSKLVIVMVGLPARGKSYITNKLTRYLNWLQHDCRVFNVGNTRRRSTKNVGPENKPLPDVITPTNEEQLQQSPDFSNVHTDNDDLTHNAAFFSPDNPETNALREKWAMDTLDQLLDYVVDGPGSVGIFDATNSTKARRARVLKRIQNRSKGELKVIFLESICSDPSIIESNIRLKLSGPDYKDMDTEKALKDFVGRLHNYEKGYETIDESEEKSRDFSYVKMIDVGKKVVAYNIKGFLASQTVYFLLNFNLTPRQIWITRHGESTDNVLGKIGGNSSITERGARFSKTLAKFMKFKREEFHHRQLEDFSKRLELKLTTSNTSNPEIDLDSENIPPDPPFCVWTSMLQRSIDTAQYFNEDEFYVKEMRMLNELSAGKCEGMTYEEIQAKYPKEFNERLNNKLSYRYPGVGGESYLDVITRLRPVITEVERTTDHLLIISHRVVARVLLAYFLNLDKSAIGELDVPLHTLYCLESKPYGTDYFLYEYDEKEDWFYKVNPEHQKNIQQVGVAFRERKYSVVPTAPPSKSSMPTGSISSTGKNLGPSFSNKNVEDLNKLRKPVLMNSKNGVPSDLAVTNESMVNVNNDNNDNHDDESLKNMNKGLRNLTIK